MSYEYDQYLQKHKWNVCQAFNWIQTNLPDLIPNSSTDLNWQIGFNHDSSKTESDEYRAYDAYFYGGNKSYSVVQEYKKAWLLHIHRNPHHWQYWVLINDDPNEGETILDMPDNYILEMICDWWSFSWASGDITSIFKWAEEHGPYIKLSSRTKDKVEKILYSIKKKLEELKDD